MTLLACLGTRWSLSIHLPFTILPCTIIIVLYLPVRTRRRFLNFTSLHIFRVPRALPSLSGYRAPEVYSCISSLTPDTTKPIGSPCLEV